MQGSKAAHGEYGLIAVTEESKLGLGLQPENKQMRKTKRNII
jgi:hypothetical protein